MPIAEMASYFPVLFVGGIIFGDDRDSYSLDLVIILDTSVNISLSFYALRSKGKEIE
jgi:hypothetical protein